MAGSNTITSNHLDIERLTWNDVRGQVSQLNPTFAKIVDKLAPSNKYALYKVRYPYGSQVLKNGKFYLPTKQGKLVAIDDSDIDSSVKNSLLYSSTPCPVLMPIHNQFELFVSLQDRIIPYVLAIPGGFFGTWKVLDANPDGRPSHAGYDIWDMTSGIRSIFMLAKITEKSGHNKLQRLYNFNIEASNDLRDHWHIFKSLAKSPNFGTSWHAEMLLFSKEWFEYLDDEAWKDFRIFMYDFNWHFSEFWRNQFVWDLTFTRIQTARDMKPSPYHADLVKHLLAIGVGALPGFVPAIDDSLAPIKQIQNIYLNDYRLKTWAPLIMQPGNYLMDNKSEHPVYYSLHHQSAIELGPKFSKRSSTIGDSYMVYSLLQKYLHDIRTMDLNIESTPLYALANKVQYDFFHTNVEDYPSIKSNNIIPEEDPAFSKAIAQFKGMEFPKNSTFFKGCIRISQKK